MKRRMCRHIVDMQPDRVMRANPLQELRIALRSASAADAEITCSRKCERGTLQIGLEINEIILVKAR